jgi:multiple sugar transport system permease protein
MATHSEVKSSALSVGTEGKRRFTLARQRTITGYIFISPFILGVLLWVLIPALVAVYLTFHDWNLIRPPRFVGLQNIQQLFSDPLLPQSLKATFTFTLLSVPLGLLFAFCLALLVNNQFRGIAIFRAIYYMPTIVPAVSNAVLWSWIFNTEFGLMNEVVASLGGTKLGWLQNPALTIPAFTIISVWSAGGTMVIFLAGLQGIPDIYYEAAEIDGAGRWEKLWNITIPLMSPIIFFNLVIGFINSFQVFANTFLITRGGPENATLFLTLYIYRTGITSLHMGYAATLSWVLFFILMALSFLVFRYVGRRVYYENPGE